MTYKVMSKLLDESCSLPRCHACITGVVNEERGVRSQLAGKVGELPDEVCKLPTLGHISHY